MAAMVSLRRGSSARGRALPRDRRTEIERRDLSSEQLFATNLVHYALKFSQGGRYVDVRTADDGIRLTVSMCDHDVFRKREIGRAHV